MKQKYIVKKQPNKATARPNAWAICSLISGILAWIILPIIGAIVAVITGHIARSKAKAEEKESPTIAFIGLLLGYLNLALFVLGIITTIMLPAYQDYVYRVKMNEAFQTIRQPIQQAEQHYLTQNEGIKFDAQAFALSSEAQLYWQSIEMQNDGLLSLTLMNQKPVPSGLRGQTILLVPDSQNQQVIWHCHPQTENPRKAQKWLPKNICQ